MVPVNQDFPAYKLHLVPFEDDHEGILTEIGRLGEKFDFLIGVCDSKAWLNLCSMLPLGRYKKMIAVSREHRLANKERLNLEDLYGETLMMVKRGIPRSTIFCGKIWRSTILKSTLKIRPTFMICPCSTAARKRATSCSQ